MKFQVKRSQWLRGEGSEKSSLLRSEDGKKCCVGFYANACGLSDEDIKNCNDLASLPRSLINEDLKKFIAVCGGGINLNNDVSCDIYSTNDEEYICDAERETVLTKYFKGIDVDVEFVD